MRSKSTAPRALALLIAAALAGGASAQTYVYPAKGQSPDKQKKDEGECHTWAVQQSKYDPTNPPPPPAATAAPNTTATGSTRGAGARGAARGAVVGEVVGDDAGTGAAVGAAAARGQSRRQNAQAGEQQQQAAAQQSHAGMTSYQKARAACLEGRGYTIK